MVGWCSISDTYYKRQQWLISQHHDGVNKFSLWNMGIWFTLFLCSYGKYSWTRELELLTDISFRGIYWMPMEIAALPKRSRLETVIYLPWPSCSDTSLFTMMKLCSIKRFFANTDRIKIQLKYFELRINGFPSWGGWIFNKYTSILLGAYLCLCIYIYG